MKRIQHWIGGGPAAGTSDRTSRVYDPATGTQTGRVALADVRDVDAAVAAATAAFPAWRATSLAKACRAALRVAARAP